MLSKQIFYALYAISPSPLQILLDYAGHIALCDFGLCKLNIKQDEKTNTFCGTPEYLAPEVLIGEGYTKSVDWWTMGTLLYEMLVGLPPFYSENQNDMYRKIVNEKLRFPDLQQDGIALSREARDLITLLLDRDPVKRFGANGAGEIRKHPFFKSIDWERLARKQIAPPFRPTVVGWWSASHLTVLAIYPHRITLATTGIGHGHEQLFRGIHLGASARFLRWRRVSAERQRPATVSGLHVYR